MVILLVLVALLIMGNAFMAGYTYGIYKTLLVTKSKPKQPETPKYNESLVDLLPNNVKQYYHENQGQNRF